MKLPRYRALSSQGNSEETISSVSGPYVPDSEGCALRMHTDMSRHRQASRTVQLTTVISASNIGMRLKQEHRGKLTVAQMLVFCKCLVGPQVSAPYSQEPATISILVQIN
jgi:hypothetical protein